MVRRRTDSSTAAERTLSPVPFCWACGQPTWVAYHGKRWITHLWGICCYTLVVRRCRNRVCPQYQWSIRPEEEGALALPNGKFGLDVIALVGQLWSVEHVGAREIYRTLRVRGIDLAQRTVAGLVRRYISLPAVPPAESAVGMCLPKGQERMVLAIDGVRTDQGPSILWVLRDILSGTVLLTRSVLGTQAVDLAALVSEVAAAVSLPITAIISEGPGIGAADCSGPPPERSSWRVTSSPDRIKQDATRRGALPISG